MKLQKFEAESMSQALHKVKAALGADAIIMDTRSVSKPGMLGLGARECVQIWATQGIADSAAPGAGAGAGAGAAGANMARLDTGLLTALHTRLGDLEAKLDLLAMTASYGNGAWARRQVAGGERGDEERAALAALARRIPVSGEIALDSSRVVALVGPTGAGKTLTAAKLAGRFALTHGASVGVVCADGFRLGAMAEMKAYCELLGLPMAEARDAAELRAAIEAEGDRDLVLIDTPGASQRNPDGLAELRALLEAAGADEVHLVLSAVSTPVACAEAAEKFGGIGATHLLFTKLDESPDPAEALATAISSGRPISYLADGQAVPHDLRPAEEAYLAGILAPNAKQETAPARGPFLATRA